MKNHELELDREKGLQREKLKREREKKIEYLI